jgi:hypothetical protein
VKPLPTICTPVPPATVPWFGINASTTGGEDAYVCIATPMTAAAAKKMGRRIREPDLQNERARGSL